MDATMPVFGKQAEGIESDFFFECDAFNATNKALWVDAGFSNACITETAKRMPYLGCCLFQPDGDINIYLSLQDMHNKTDDYHDFLIFARGINYHEIAHALFTVRWPVETYKARDGYDSKEVWRALNYLTDQRDELFLLTIYPHLEKYLRYVSMHPNLIKGLNEKTSPNENSSKEDAQKAEENKTTAINKMQANIFLLSWGRRFFLPDSYIALLETSFTEEYGAEVLEGIKSVIDRFLVSTEFPVQEDLVYEFIDLLRKCGAAGLPSLTIEMDEETFKQMVKSGGISCGNCGDNVQKIKVRIKNSSGQSGEGSSGDEEGEGEGKGKDGDKEGEGKGKDKNSGGKDGKHNKQGDMGEGGKGPRKKQVGDTFQDQKDAMKDDAQGMEDSIKQAALSAGVNSSDEIGDPFRPTPNALELKRHLEEILNRARTSMGSHHVKKLKRGALDSNRARLASRTNDRKIFRKFEPSKIKKLRLAAALVLDQSGSMSSESTTAGVSNIQVATDITWAIAASLQNYDGVTSVVGFDTVGKVMKQFDGRMDNWYLKADGGTDPGDSFTVVEKSLLPYLRERLPCLCVVITDGIWGGEEGRRGIAKLNSKGVWTVEILIETSYQIESHGCRYTYTVNSLAECPAIVETVVNDIQQHTRRMLGG